MVKLCFLFATKINDINTSHMRARMHARAQSHTCTHASHMHARTHTRTQMTMLKITCRMVLNDLV